MTRHVDLKALTRDEMAAFVSGLGLPSFRTDQLLQWIYLRGATDINKISVLSKGLRQRLSEVARISSLELALRSSSKDGTGKFLFRLDDGLTIESVAIPDEERLTLCISSQAGCAMGCAFCLTGKVGMIRNLKAHEIVDQVICATRLLEPARITNIVLMGMGEPLANLDEVSEALRRIIGLLGFSKRRITLSTCGLVPGIERFAKTGPDVNLAVSLNATTDNMRDRIMPVNRRYPLKTLMQACRKYPLAPRRRITFEYVLIGGENDSAEDAKRLAALVRGIPCKVNLIPLNATEGTGMKSPLPEQVLRFQEILAERHVAALIRKSKGQDILAACGQLRADYEEKKKSSEKAAGRTEPL